MKLVLLQPHIISKCTTDKASWHLFLLTANLIYEDAYPVRRHRYIYIDIYVHICSKHRVSVAAGVENQALEHLGNNLYTHISVCVCCQALQFAEFLGKCRNKFVTEDKPRTRQINFCCLRTWPAMENAALSCRLQNPSVYRDAKLFVLKVSDSLTEKFAQLKRSDINIF